MIKRVPLAAVKAVAANEKSIEQRKAVLLDTIASFKRPRTETQKRVIRLQDTIRISNLCFGRSSGKLCRCRLIGKIQGRIEDVCDLWNN